MKKMNKSTVLFTITITIVLFILITVVVVLLGSFNSKSNFAKKLSVKYANKNLISNKSIKTKITKEEVYTYKIPASLDFTKVLQSNFEKDRPQAKLIDSLGNTTGTEFYDYDSFISEEYFKEQGLPRSVEKYVDYKNLNLKKVSELTDLEKLTIYSYNGIDPETGKTMSYFSRIEELLNLCMGYYRETGKVPVDMWNFGFFRDTVLLEFGNDWKADFDELITVEPGCAYFISPITGEFFSFNNPQYKKGQMYIQPITDQNYITSLNMVGPNDQKLEINKNFWILYYRVYGEEPNTIIKEDVWCQGSEDLLNY